MRLKTLEEAKRIIKSEGKIIIADYQRRSQKLIRRLVYSLTKTWESKYYEDFLDKGVDYYLQHLNLKPNFRKSYLMGELELLDVIK